MIGMQYFSRMKKTAYFINTARGGLVDQPALVEALQQGCMAGAALDVYDSEPLAVDDSLLQMDNVLLTPHIAGTTVDAIPRAPFLLMREVEHWSKEETECFCRKKERKSLYTDRKCSSAV